MNNFTEAYFLSQKSQELEKTKGIIILKPMDKEKRKIIHLIVLRSSNMASFSIGTEPFRSVVLKYQTRENLDTYKLRKDGQEAFNNEDYDTCINLYKKEMSFYKRPRFQTFAKIGSAYAKKADLENAINYLTVASELALAQKCEHKYTKLIISLQEQLSTFQKEQKIKFLDDLEEIINIIMGSGLGSIDSVCTAFFLDEFKKCLLIILLASEYYKKEEYEIGDELLRRVEKEKNKYPETKKIFSEVKMRKRFWKNQADGSLVRILQRN